MLRKLLIPILILISSLSYAKLDEDFLSNELYKVTNHNLKNNVYTFHLAANDFREMTASEYSLNLKNIEKMVNTKSILNNFTQEEIYYIQDSYNSVIKNIYENINPNINSAVTLNFKVKDYFFTMILIPNLYYVNYSNCEGTFILFDSYVCFEVDDTTKYSISDFLKKTYIKSLSSDFMGEFTIIHEYSHLLSEQLRLDNKKVYESIKNNKIKKDINLIRHYNEIYSDIYAGIRLLQKGYKKEDLDQVIFMRNMAMYLYKDSLHFSSPYLKLLKNLDPENYMMITSFNEFDTLINKIFFDVINRVDTTNDKLFYAEKLESKKAIDKISNFIALLNKRNLSSNSLRFRSQEDIEFLDLLFNGFIGKAYYASIRFELEYKDY